MTARRAMGLDVGERRIGVALGDLLGLTAQPLEVIERDPRCSPYERLAAIAAEHGVTDIVVGLPVNMNASEGPQAAATRVFAKGLRRRLKGVLISFQDERLTTAASERAMIEGDARREERRERRDMIAAALILQTWLDARGSKDSSCSGTPPAL